jgi:MtN3 and saliva related transmembrane protein
MTKDMFFTIIGMMAAMLTSTGLIPQAYKGLKTKSLKDVSTGMLVVLIFGTFLWFIYGLYREDKIIVFANVLTFTLSVFVLYLKKHYQKTP